MSVAIAKISRRTALTLGAAAFAAGSLSCPAIGGGNARVLRYVPGFNPSSLDPLWVGSVANIEAGLMVFDTLYGLDASLAPQPQMVEGHDLSADQRVWRFTLREGLRFHDGEPVRAGDAVASIGRWAQRAPLGVRMKTLLDEQRVIDDRRFEIRLKKPFPHLLYGLGLTRRLPRQARACGGPHRCVHPCQGLHRQRALRVPSGRMGFWLAIGVPSQRALCAAAGTTVALGRRQGRELRSGRMDDHPR